MLPFADYLLWFIYQFIPYEVKNFNTTLHYTKTATPEHLSTVACRVQSLPHQQQQPTFAFYCPLFLPFVVCLNYQCCQLFETTQQVDNDLVKGVITMGNLESCAVALRIWFACKYFYSQNLLPIYPVYIGLLIITTKSQSFLSKSVGCVEIDLRKIQ